MSKSKVTSSEKKKEMLGQGIRSLLKNINQEVVQTEPPFTGSIMQNIHFIMLPLNQIVPNPNQPRKKFDEQAMVELANSIKTHSIIQPITVTKYSMGKYMIVSGERRWRAATMAGIKEIPAFIRSTEQDQDILEMALLENLQREDLNAIEIAFSFKTLMEECSLTHEQLSERIGKDRTTVTNYVRLLKLPPSVQIAVREGKLSMGHARTLLSLENVDEQLMAYDEIQNKNLSVRQTEQLINNMLQRGNNFARDNKGKNNSKTKLPAPYIKLQDKLSSHFSTKVLVEYNQKTSKGNISINYNSIENLNAILEKIGVYID